MIRTVVTPDNQDIYLRIPESYVGKEIEVIAFAIDEPTPETKKLKMADFWESLSDETAAELHKETNESRESWEERLNKQF
jgi:hypothetical protein